MNRKSIITVIIAALLAFLCAFLIFGLNKKEAHIYENTQKVETEVLEKDDLTVDNMKSSEKEKLETEKKDIISDKQEQKVFKITEEKKDIVEQPIVQEVSIVEEVQDFGIRKTENGEFEITREFKTISPTKFSFKGYGVLDKISD